MCSNQGDLMDIENKMACCLSVTDLLERSYKLMDANKMFPLINIETYVKNTREGIHFVERSESDDDISKYIQSQRQSISSVLLIQDVPCLTPILARGATSFKLSPPQKPYQNISHSHEFLTVESCLKNIMRDCRSPSIISSTSLVSVNSTLPNFGMVSNTFCIWFACHITYLPVSNQLKVEVEKQGKLLNEFAGKKCSITAKICLLPGKLQKQSVTVFANQAKQIKTASAHFKGFDESQYKSMKIGVQLFLKKGVLKRRTLLREWVVPLADVDLRKQKDIYWIKHEERF